MRLESKRFQQFCENANVFLDIVLADDFVCPGLLAAMVDHDTPLLIETTTGVRLVVVAVTMSKEELKEMIDHAEHCDGLVVRGEYGDEDPPNTD